MEKNDSTIMAATALHVENEIQASNRPIRSNSETRSRKAAPIWSVLRKARTRFNAQLTQDSNTKIACINASIPLYYDDPLRFWMDLRSESNRLLDSVRFNSTCKGCELNPEYVAEHIVFEGSSVINQIIRNGVDGVMGERIRMFQTPLFSQGSRFFTESH